MYSENAINLGSILSCPSCALSKKYRICWPSSLHLSYLSDMHTEFLTNRRKKNLFMSVLSKDDESLFGLMYSIAAYENTKGTGIGAKFWAVQNPERDSLAW